MFFEQDFESNFEHPTCQGSSFYDYLMQAEESKYDETAFKSNVNKANNLFNLDLYYSSAIKQASVKFESFYESDGYESYWTYKPVIKFADGSAYSTFDAFFTESEFDGLISSYNALVADFENMMNGN
ncbi:MAG TPA: hypothetical protein PLB70_07265 [Paludibacteraceae bacterium]|nr:hypothetical protein [Paludibacteraceae bacterium]